MLKFINQFFIVRLIFSGLLARATKVSDRIKCLCLNNSPCLAKLTLTGLNSDEFHYYPFMVRLYRCDGSCNTLDDLSSGICALNKTDDVHLNVNNMITRRNESKELKKYISCDYK